MMTAQAAQLDTLTQAVQAISVMGSPRFEEPPPPHRVAEPQPAASMPQQETNFSVRHMLRTAAQAFAPEEPQERAAEPQPGAEPQPAAAPQLAAILPAELSEIAALPV